MHDVRMLGESGLYQSHAQFAFSRNGDPMCIYGDPAYPLRMQFQAPFRLVDLHQEMLDYNKSLRPVRVAVWQYS